MIIDKKKMYRHRTENQALHVRPVFEDFHRLRVIEKGDYPLHRHVSYEMIVVKKGPYQCMINGEVLSIEEGCFLIIKPGDNHQDHFREGQEHFVLHFHIDGGEERGSSKGIPLFIPHVSPQDQSGKESSGEAFIFFNRLQGELERADRFSGFIQDSLLETFFWQMVRSLPAGALSRQFHRLTSHSDFNSRMEEIFSENYHHHFGVVEMAQALGITPRTLTNRCRSFLGRTPARAFTEYRIKKAAHVLLTENPRINTLSEEFGFENPFHFSRVFKSIMGLSPRSYRENFRNT
jgi:AraC-like DNA-binding protein